MRSRHADEFNHDPWADAYDAGVRDGSNPIRAAYAEVLRWTVDRARIGPTDVVLDLGAGTGNTTALVPAAARVILVDVSPRMLAQASAKVAHLAQVEVRQVDLLEAFDTELPPLDAIVSTYAVHHLTAAEKARLFHEAHRALRPGGRAVFGDLMFESEAARSALAAAWTDEERRQVLKSLDEEFPWRVDQACRHLEAAGLAVLETNRFSVLSWGIATHRPPA